jgi:hypothetical protein
MWAIGLIGVLLVIVWLLGLILFDVSGFALNLLLFIGAVMLVIGLIDRLRDGRPRVR